MYETVNDLFDSVREAAGGIEELELQERWPDSRMWRYYRDFLHQLSGKVKLAGQSTSFYSYSNGVGEDNFITLGQLDRATLRVFWSEVPTSEGSYVELVPLTEAQAWTEGGQPYAVLERGTPAGYFLDTSDPTAPVLNLVPQPEDTQHWSVYLLGLTTPSLTEPTWGEDGMLQEGDWTIPTLFPAAFGRAAYEHLLYWVKRSGEEWTDERDEYQRKLMAQAMLEGLREFNGMMHGVSIVQRPRLWSTVVKNR